MAEVAYLLLLDGIGPAFVTTEQVTDAYVQALGFTEAYPGLDVPDNLPCGVDIRTGMLDPSSARFVIRDLDGTLPALFGANEDDAEDLITKVEAGTTATGASLYDRHIGVEKIGSAGERRRHSCVPGYHVGLEHISATQASLANGSPSPVSDAPIVWAGRRFALYRLERVGGSWTDLSTAEGRRLARVYWGTLTGQGTAEGRVWTLEAMGPESWLQRSIGTGFSAEPLPVEALVELDEDANEHVLVGWLDRVNLFDETDVDGTYATQTTDTTSLAGATSYEDLAAALHTFLQSIAGATSGDAGYAFDSISGNDIWYSSSPGSDGVYLQWNPTLEFGNLPAYYTLRLQVLASEKVWKGLGFDPKVQTSNVDPVANFEKFGQFEVSVLDIDYPGHWLGVFYTADAYGMKQKVEGKEGLSAEGQAYNNGAPRRWPPIYSGGASVFDLNAAAQFFRVRTLEPLYLPSSKAVPLPPEPDDSSTVLAIPNTGDATHQGLVVLTGPFRDESDPEADVTTITLPVRVAWRESPDGSVATDGQYPTLAVYDWPEPRLYGLDEERPTLWAGWRSPPEDGDPTTMRPLLALEHGTRGDSLPYLLARLWATTGAAGGWYADAGLTTPAYGLEGGSYLDVGPNDLGLTGFGDEGLGAFTDAETSVYGFAIPAEMIADSAELGSLELVIEELADADLARAKVALGKVASATDVQRSLLSPTGWAVSLAGGRFGLFDPFRFVPAPADEGEITIETIAGRPGEPQSAILQQQLREHAPIDRIDLKARLDPAKGSHAITDTLISADPQRLYRSQSIRQQVDGSHLLHPSLPSLPGSNWGPGFNERWRFITRWWARQHFKLMLSVPMRRQAEFWPGSPISVTNPWVVNPTGGTYGITQAPGYVVRRAAKPGDGVVDLEVLVDSSSTRLYAPAARATEYRANTDGQGHRLFVEDDYLGIRGNSGTFDCEGFVEPPWSDVGGAADVEIWAFDGVEWTKALYGTVDSVNAEAGNCWIKLTEAPTGGTWYRDQHHLVVLRDADNQGAAWVFEVYAPIGDEDGNYTGSTKAPRFKD